MPKKRMNVATRKLVRMQRAIANSKTTIIGSPNPRRKPVSLPDITILKKEPVK